MAEELRGEQYFDLGAAADVTGQALIENTADKDMFIRSIHVSSSIEGDGSANVARAAIQIGKNNARDTTDGASGVKFQLSHCLKSSATGGDFTDDSQRSWYLAKGQFVLEPGETLYYNNDKDFANMSAYSGIIDIWYHY